MTLKIQKLRFHLKFSTNIKGKEENVLMKKGVMNAHVYLNASTRNLYTELDFTITAIRFHKKYDNDYIYVCVQNFILQSQKKQYYKIPIKHNITFAFSGYMPNHQQVLTQNQATVNFINTSLYKIKDYFTTCLNHVKAG